MKRNNWIFGISFIISLFLIIPALAQEMPGGGPPQNIGPTAEEIACMRPCAQQGCPLNDMACMMKNGPACQIKCNVKKPEANTPEIACMEECVQTGCSVIDFACQTKNRDKCEKSCNMIKEPEPKSEEERCIRDCVRKADPKLMCKPGEGGEKGNEICQTCAKSCENLYAGPCLDDAKLKAKQKSCQTCEHCYGEPIMGDSGEGYECIVDVECKDASGEFGDDPGSGPGIGKGSESEENIVEKTVNTISNTMSNAAEKFTGFFKRIFGRDRPPQSEENEFNFSEQERFEERNEQPQTRDKPESTPEPESEPVSQTPSSPNGFTEFIANIFSAFSN